MSDADITLAKLVRARREQLGLSKMEVARRIGAKDTTVLRIETGEIRRPRGDMLRALAETLGLPSADLFAAAGYAAPTELPSFRPYLRTKYAELPPDALAELEATFVDIARRYGTSGPNPGEDEH